MIERVTFHSPETGFAVLKVQVPGHRALVPVVGSLPTVTAGEWLEAEGDWVQDRDHGRQFAAQTLRTSPPTSTEGIQRYLGSGMVRGLGPQLAAKLVDHFGPQILEIIEQASAKLEQVEGIGPKRRRRIKEAWQEQREIRSIMLFLHSHGISTSRAVRIHKAYGSESIQRVQADPYLLARDIPGIGFKSADQIARRLGIAEDAPERLSAGLRHVLLEATQEGHCALPLEALVGTTAELLQVDATPVRTSLSSALDRRELILESVEQQDLIYVPFLLAAENQIARELLGLATQGSVLPPIDIDKARDWFESRSGQTLSPSQSEALRAALTGRLLVITGGPGVGKTTLIRSILAILRAKKVSCVLAAPTGRAAQRLSEATELPASTLHRLLEARGGPGQFGRNAERPLEGDFFVVDEVSMVDVPLGAAFLRALPDQASLLLVGDADQLPSVGPGTVLADLLAAPAIRSVRLTEVFRQAAQSRIIRNAHRIQSGQLPELDKMEADSDFFFLEREEPERISETVVDLVARRLPARYGLDPIQQIQVLGPMNRGPLGVRELNLRLQAALNPETTKLEVPLIYGNAFRPGDKVMQLENDYDREVFNGDIGRIQRFDMENQTAWVQFDQRLVEFPFQEMDSLVLAYAITVHKSQGSEFPAVVIPLATSHYLLLQRNLLYTAMTRARRLVVLVGQRRALQIAVKQVDARHRHGGLRWRLRNLDQSIS